jgi:hypothetical protein
MKSFFPPAGNDMQNLRNSSSFIVPPLGYRDLAVKYRTSIFDTNAMLQLRAHWHKKFHHKYFQIQWKQQSVDCISSSEINPPQGYRDYTIKKI